MDTQRCDSWGSLSLSFTREIVKREFMLKLQGSSSRYLGTGRGLQAHEKGLPWACDSKGRLRRPSEQAGLCRAGRCGARTRTISSRNTGDIRCWKTHVTSPDRTQNCVQAAVGMHAPLPCFNVKYQCVAQRYFLEFLIHFQK